MPITGARVALTVLAGLSAVLHVRAEYRGPQWRVYLFKPLTTMLLIVLALVGAAGAGEVGGRYPLAIAAGLALSLFGDVFLMLPGDRFVPGLASFLLAHLAYLAAFTTGAGFGAVPLMFVPYGLAGAVVLAVLWPRLGHVRGSVALYVVVIMAMAGQAAVRAVILQATPAVLAAAGAALFVASDTILAIDRFHTRFRSARALVMGTYVPAQWLIALSAGMGVSG